MLRRAVSLALGLVLSSILACGSKPDDGKTPSGARASCHTDDECVVTNQSGCCQACPSKPTAIPRLSFEQQQNRCAAASCVAASDRIECPPVDAPGAFVAKCDHGTCAAVKR